MSHEDFKLKIENPSNEDVKLKCEKTKLEEDKIKYEELSIEKKKIKSENPSCQDIKEKGEKPSIDEFKIKCKLTSLEDDKVRCEKPIHRLRGGAKKKGDNKVLVAQSLQNLEESLKPMVSRAISCAESHGINVHRGVENLANGDCAFETIIDGISTRSCFRDTYDGTPEH